MGYLNEHSNGKWTNGSVYILLNNSPSNPQLCIPHPHPHPHTHYPSSQTFPPFSCRPVYVPCNEPRLYGRGIIGRKCLATFTTSAEVNETKTFKKIFNYSYSLCNIEQRISLGQKLVIVIQLQSHVL